MHTIVYAFDEFDMSVEKRVLSALDAEIIVLSSLNAPEAPAALARADALVITLQSITGEVMDRMPNCAIISRLGVGVDNIDLKAATQRGIWVTNVPDYGTDEVATHAITLMLALARGIAGLVANTRAGNWNDAVARPVRRLLGQTVGVLGFGRIGQAFAKKALGFGVRVIAHDPYVSAAEIAKHGAEAVNLETLFRTSDFISLHAPLNDETRKLVNSARLALMKPSAYLINTARGGLIDEAALLHAVQSAQLRGAALDVLSAEPPPADNAVLAALLADERILVTPHFAWYSEDGLIDQREKGADEVLRILSGRAPRSPVNTPLR